MHTSAMLNTINRDERDAAYAAVIKEWMADAEAPIPDTVMKKVWVHFSSLTLPKFVAVFVSCDVPVNSQCMWAQPGSS